MISFEDAKNKAKNLSPGIDYYTEQEKCFTFINSDYDFSDGGDGPVVIEKNSGECFNLLWAMENNLLDDKVPERIKL